MQDVTQNIPQDLWVLVVSFCPHESLAMLGVTSKYFHAVVDDSRIWRARLEKDYAIECFAPLEYRVVHGAIHAAFISGILREGGYKHVESCLNCNKHVRRTEGGMKNCSIYDRHVVDPLDVPRIVRDFSMKEPYEVDYYKEDWYRVYCSLIQQAAEQNIPALMDFFMEMYRKFEDRTNTKRKESLLWLALCRSTGFGRLEMLETLLSVEEVDATDPWKDTPFNEAMLPDQYQDVFCLRYAVQYLDRREVLERLLRVPGIDVTTRGGYLLYIGAYYDNVEATSTLLKYAEYSEEMRARALGYARSEEMLALLKVDGESK